MDSAVSLGTSPSKKNIPTRSLVSLYAVLTPSLPRRRLKETATVSYIQLGVLRPVNQYGYIRATDSNKSAGAGIAQWLEHRTRD